MKTNLLRMARRNFIHPDAPRHVARHNIRAWVRSLRFLGPNWRGLASVLPKCAN